MRCLLFHEELYKSACCYTKDINPSSYIDQREDINQHDDTTNAKTSINTKRVVGCEYYKKINKGREKEEKRKRHL